MLRKIANIILGVHPNNTFFSFNWHNVRHINTFYQKVSDTLPKANLIVADIGSGKSPYYTFFSQHCREYIAIDMKETLPKDEKRQIRQIPGTAENIPLDDNFVDVIICNQVLEHVIDPIKSVQEIYRVLKPGGLFFGSVPHVSPIHLEPYDFRRYTELGLKQLLDQVNFECIHVEGNGGVFSTVAFIVAMDMLLSERKELESQRFNSTLAVLISPIIGFLNIMGLLADKVFGDKKRTPANLCWSAFKR